MGGGTAGIIFHCKYWGFDYTHLNAQEMWQNEAGTAAPPNNLTLKILLSFCFAGVISMLKVTSLTKIASEAAVILAKLTEEAKETLSS